MTPMCGGCKCEPSFAPKGKSGFPAGCCGHARNISGGRDRHAAGFSDVSAIGYSGMVFVLPQFGRRGVAGALLSEIGR